MSLFGSHAAIIRIKRQTCGKATKIHICVLLMGHLIPLTVLFRGNKRSAALRRDNQKHFPLFFKYHFMTSSDSFAEQMQKRLGKQTGGLSQSSQEK